MRRFLDAIVFFLLAVIDLGVYFGLASFNQTGQTADAQTLQWSSVTVTFFMFPVLVMFFMMALVRAIVNRPPGRFYMWSLLVFAASGAIMFGVSFLPLVGPNQIGATVMVMFFGASAITSLLGIVLGITKAIEYLTAEEKEQRAQDAADLAQFRSQQQAEKEAAKDTPETEGAPEITPAEAAELPAPAPVGGADAPAGTAPQTVEATVPATPEVTPEAGTEKGTEKGAPSSPHIPIEE